MDISSCGRRLARLAAAVCMTIFIGGCAAPERAGGGGDATGADDDVAGSTQAMADRLSDAMRDRWQPPMDDLTDEQWDAMAAARRARDADDDAEPADEPEPKPEPEPADPLPAEPAPMTRGELLAELLDRVRDGEESAVSKALIGAALSLADPQHELDARLTGSLDESQRRRVDLYHQLVLTFGQELAQAGELNRASIDRRLDELFRDRPVEIGKVALCRRVSGFGVYDPFESRTFLAGQDQRAIVYVELDHFRTRRRDDGEHEVKLKQEVVLYNESDGLAVWRHDPVQITDVSRNRRRDFFHVQMITLPARISVGKYLLKVRVTDEHGGSLDESTMPLEFVADAALVRKAE